MPQSLRNFFIFGIFIGFVKNVLGPGAKNGFLHNSGIDSIEFISFLN